MVVGILTIELHLPYCRSLKDKRKVVKSIKEKLRGRHNVSVAEVDGQDTWQRSVLGMAAVADRRSALESLYESIQREIESSIPGEITRAETEYL